MKYKDYCGVMGFDRNATCQDTEKAYRKLARKYNPEVSTDPDGEGKFKEPAEGYETLKTRKSGRPAINWGAISPARISGHPPTGEKSRFAALEAEIR